MPYNSILISYNGQEPEKEIYLCIMNRFAVWLKLTQHCKLYFKWFNNNNKLKKISETKNNWVTKAKNEDIVPICRCMKTTPSNRSSHHPQGFLQRLVPVWPPWPPRFGLECPVPIDLCTTPPDFRSLISSSVFYLSISVNTSFHSTSHLALITGANYSTPTTQHVLSRCVGALSAGGKIFGP